MSEISRRAFLAASAGAGAGLAVDLLGLRGSLASAVESAPDSAVVKCPIDPSDGRDVTAALNAWLGSLTSGTTADLNGATYRCETAVKVVDATRLTIRNGTLVRTVVGARAWPEPNPHLWLLHPTGCRVENLTVRGTNVVPDQLAGFAAYKMAYEFEAAVRMERFTNCAVTGLDVDAVWGDGVQWQVGTGGYIADSVIRRNGRQGVTIICRDFLAERVRVESTRRSGFDIEPDTAAQGVGNIEIRNCYTYGYHVAFASAGRGPIDNVYIHHNLMRGPGVPVIYVAASDGARRTNWRFEDNVCDSQLGSPVEAVRMTNVSGISIKRNVLPVVTTQSRISVGLTRCGGRIRIFDNDFGDGDRFFNRSPLRSQRLRRRGNSPAQRRVR